MIWDYFQAFSFIGMVCDSMKKSEIVLREYSLKGKKIITASELKELCIKYNFDFKKTKVGLLNKGYLLTIFRGIYYLKDYNEKKTGAIIYSANELLSLGLKKKGIKNWYLGLNTALKIQNITHEIFTVNYVLNDRFNRTNPIDLHESRFLFRKIKTPLFSFGIKETTTKNNIPIKYSDPEKTLLDMAYLYLLSGKSNAATLLINEYKTSINTKKLLKYAKNYPKTLKNLISEAL